jgi:hypothetical protein
MLYGHWLLFAGVEGQAVKLTAHTEVVCACNSVVFLHDVTATTSPLPNITIGCQFLCTEVECKVSRVLVMKECVGNRGIAPLILRLFATWK